MNGRRIVTRSSGTTGLTAALAGALLAALASAPAWLSADALRLLTDVFLYVALACMWNFLAGYAGLASVGQQAFVGLGGYGLFALAMHAGVPVLLGVPVVGLLAACLSVPMAAVLFRLRGAFFAIGSWVMAEVFRLLVSLVMSLGGGSGLSLPVSLARTLGQTASQRYSSVYLAALALAATVLVMIFLVLRSRTGLALTAIRDNELAARSNGIDVGRTKLIVYMATAFGTSMAGALIFLQRLRISPDAAFSVNDWTALVIFMVVIGGIGSFEGPIVGVLAYFALRELLASLGPLYLMVLGAVAILVMLFEPRGLWGYVRARWRFEILPLSLIVRRSGEATLNAAVATRTREAQSIEEGPAR